MPKGRCVLDYASCGSVEMVEMFLDCGYIQRDRGLANSAIENLARLGRLDLMQQVILLHSPPLEDQPLCLHAWWSAITTACENGYLEMLQWLLDHPLEQELRAYMKLHRKYTQLVLLAARNNHAEIMQYLYEQGAGDEVDADRVVAEYARELKVSIRDDRYKTVKWMVENIPFLDTGVPEVIIAIVARYQRFNILKLFHEQGSPGVIDLTQNEDSRAQQVAAWWSRFREVMDFAAGSGRLDMFQWLLANHPQVVTKDAMDRVAVTSKWSSSFTQTNLKDALRRRWMMLHGEATWMW